MQEIRSSNLLLVTGICDPNKSRAQHYRNFKLGSNLRYLKIKCSFLYNVIFYIIIKYRNFSLQERNVWKIGIPFSRLTCQVETLAHLLAHCTFIDTLSCKIEKLACFWHASTLAHRPRWHAGKHGTRFSKLVKNVPKYFKICKKNLLIMILFYHLTLSWRRLLWYGNQSIDLRCKYITISVIKELTNYGVSNLNSIYFQRKKYQVVWKTRCLCYDDNLYNILRNNICNILRNIYM